MAATPDEDLGFTFQRRADEVLILRHSRPVTTLRDKRATEFLAEVEGGGEAEAQQLMARLTGSYKHGNERVPKSHPRNRR